MKVKDRCVAFNSRIYKDDKSTPLSITMQSGSVVDIRKGSLGRDICDIKFDHDPRISKGHFITSVKISPLEMKTTNKIKQ